MIAISVAKSEIKLLQFLSDANANPSERGEVAQVVKHYRWSVPDNTILFECICELLLAAPRQILAHLPAALTRRGFPDISCDALAGPSPMNTDEALALAQQLLRASQ
jgi:hypothetical protein